MIDLGEKVGDDRRRWADFRRGIDEQVTKGRQEHVGAGVVQLLRLSREFDRGKIDNESDKQQIEGGWQAGSRYTKLRRASGCRRQGRAHVLESPSEQRRNNSASFINIDCTRSTVAEWQT